MTEQHINLTADFLPKRQPNASCFIFFSTAQNVLKFRQPHIGTFGFAPTAQAETGKTKRANFAIAFNNFVN
jgi:hypothetical protein